MTMNEATAISEKVNINLEGVPETMLWPLWNRGAEQKHKEPLLIDPMAADLLERIDYDFWAHFGAPNVSHVIRARVMDDIVGKWLKKNESGTVISLGEGLDTQFWRVDNGSMKWISVDLPESIDARLRFLPSDDRMQTVSCSALDTAWLDAAPKGEPACLMIAGLLMYFQEHEVRNLLYRIANHFVPGTELFFDAIPPWLARKTMSKKGWFLTKTYKAPPMPWGIRYNELEQLLVLHPSYRIIQQLTYADPYPQRMKPYCYMVKIAWLKNKLAPWMAHLTID